MSGKKRFISISNPAVKLIQAKAITGAVERYVKKCFKVSKKVKNVILNSKSIDLFKKVLFLAKGIRYSK